VRIGAASAVVLLRATSIVVLGGEIVTQINGDGFGNPANLTLCPIRPLGDWLHAGLFDPSQDEEVWRSRGGFPDTFVKSFDEG
jgi:hypothetical protein